MSSELVKSVNTPTLKSLQRRWQRKTGEPMPDWIARLDLPLVERAVKHRGRESGRRACRAGRGPGRLRVRGFHAGVGYG
jgi:hypothetical protein